MGIKTKVKDCSSRLNFETVRALLSRVMIPQIVPYILCSIKYDIKGFIFYLLFLPQSFKCF